MPLEQVRQQYALLDALPLGVFILDREGRFTFVNETAGRFFRALVGRSTAEVLGQNIWECCPEFADSTFTREQQQAVAGLRTFELEAFYPGLQRWFLILASFTSHGQTFTLQDVTAQKLMEKQNRNRLDQLAAELDAQTEFVMHVAQEVGNALAVLRSDFFLTRQQPEGAEQKMCALTALTGDLVKVCQLRLGQVSPRKELVGLGKAASQAVEAIRQRPEAHGRNLTVSLSPGPLWVIADPVQLGDAVYHLLQCAVTCTSSADHLGLSAESHAGQVVLRIAVDGVSFGAEALPHPCDLFSKGEAAWEPKRIRVSTGLALVRGLIELQGGTVQAFSKGPGCGSEFIISMPAAPAATNSGEPSSPPAQQSCG